MSEVLERARADARALVEAGFDGIGVENFGDAPFFPDQVPPVTVAAMTRAADAVAQALPPGVQLVVNVLRNDAASALAVAHAVGAAAIRVNVHVGARVTDQGILSGQAHRTLRLRREIGAELVAIWADVQVKHSGPLGPTRPFAEEVRECAGRGLADVLLVTGPATGTPVDPERLDAARVAAPGVPILVGSGVRAETVASLLERADGVVVGTSIKVDGETTAPVDPGRARALVEAARAGASSRRIDGPRALC